MLNYYSCTSAVLPLPSPLSPTHPLVEGELLVLQSEPVLTPELHSTGKGTGQQGMKVTLISGPDTYSHIHYNE